MSSFIHAGAVEMTVVVLLCYGIAVKEGHVKAWLPSISACGELPPEVCNISLDTAVINDCGVIELGIASELNVSVT